MNAKSFNLSAQGSSHIKKNKECQDSSRSYYDENMAIAIVCDGHGGDDYMRSAYGSLFACNAAERNIKKFLDNISKEKFFENPEKMLTDLEASIINVWNQLIYAHYDKNPFTEQELSSISEKAKRKYMQDKRIESAYGTTLIAVAMTSEYWFGIHIGDGKCVAVNPEGKFVQPIPWDEKCFLNATTSICDSDALGSFRHFYSEKLPVAVFVGSDGIDDCFSNNEQLNNLYKTIIYSFGTSEFSEAIDDLKEYLPRLSAKGSGDDVSIAAILDFELLSGLEMVKGYDREKEKARVEENARKEAEKNEAERRRVEEEHTKFLQNNKKHANAVRKPKFCINCGVQLLMNAKFCTECGTKVVAVSESQIAEVSPGIQSFPIKQYNSDIPYNPVIQQSISITEEMGINNSEHGDEFIEEKDFDDSEENHAESAVAEVIENSNNGEIVENPSEEFKTDI